MKSILAITALLVFVLGFGLQQSFAQVDATDDFDIVVSKDNRWGGSPDEYSADDLFKAVIKTEVPWKWFVIDSIESEGCPTMTGYNSVDYTSPQPYKDWTDTTYLAIYTASPYLLVTFYDEYPQEDRNNHEYVYGGCIGENLVDLTESE